MNEIIYFELNNWFRGTDYLNSEPFVSWMQNDLNIKVPFSLPPTISASISPIDNIIFHLQ
jgi:hypothetical protein